jgi:hypothetical protein
MLVVAHGGLEASSSSVTSDTPLDHAKSPERLMPGYRQHRGCSKHRIVLNA